MASAFPASPARPLRSRSFTLSSGSDSEMELDDAVVCHSLNLSNLSDDGDVDTGTGLDAMAGDAPRSPRRGNLFGGPAHPAPPSELQRFPSIISEHKGPDSPVAPGSANAGVRVGVCRAMRGLAFTDTHDSPARSLFGASSSSGSISLGTPNSGGPNASSSSLLAAAAAAAAGDLSAHSRGGIFSSPEHDALTPYHDTPKSPSSSTFHISAVATPDASSRANITPHTSRKKARRSLTPSSGRPTPDQDAFEFHEPLSHTPNRDSPACPPTPARTPGWKMLALKRENSLQVNRVLMKDSDDDSDDDRKGGPEAFVGRHKHTNRHAVSFENDFDNLGEIGEGSFCKVFKARSKQDGEVYAVKRTLRPYRSRRDRDQLLNEFRMVSTIEANPCVIHYKRVWQEQAHLYQQVELCPRGSLADLLTTMGEDEAVPAEAVYTVIADTAKALISVHKAGLVHLDIKPDNLFISKSGMLKVGDFGSARPVTTWDGGDDDGAEGDCRYMAKELLNSGGVRYAADIFSLGMTAYEMAWDTVPPMDGPDWHDVREGRIPAVPQRCMEAGRPAELLAIIRRMLHPDPTQRPTAQELFDIPAVRAAHGSAHEVLQRASEAVTDPVKRRQLLGVAQPHTLGRSGSYAACELVLPDFTKEAEEGTPAAPGPAAPTPAAAAPSLQRRPSLRRSSTITPAGIALARGRANSQPSGMSYTVNSGGAGPPRLARQSSAAAAQLRRQKTVALARSSSHAPELHLGIPRPNMQTLMGSDAAVCTPTDQGIRPDWNRY